jgi:hypothetical protein
MSESGEEGNPNVYRLEQFGLCLKGEVLSKVIKESLVADYSLADLSEATLQFQKTPSDWIGAALSLVLLLSSGAGFHYWAIPSGSVLAWVLCGIVALVSLLFFIGAVFSKTAGLTLKGKHGIVEFPLLESREVVEAFFGEMRERAVRSGRGMGFRIRG